MERLFGILLSLYRGTSQHGEWVIECLKGSWPRLVGDKLAEVCRPVALVGSELKIEILDDAWEGAVRSVRLELQDKLRVVTAGEVKTLTLSNRWVIGGSADDAGRTESKASHELSRRGGAATKIKSSPRKRGELKN
jgi:hypothetical protein